MLWGKRPTIFFQNAEISGRAITVNVREDNRSGELRITGVPEEEARTVGTEAVFKEIEIRKVLLSYRKS